MLLGDEAVDAHLVGHEARRRAQLGEPARAPARRRCSTAEPSAPGLSSSSVTSTAPQLRSLGAASDDVAVGAERVLARRRPCRPAARRARARADAGGARSRWRRRSCRRRRGGPTEAPRRRPRPARTVSPAGVVTCGAQQSVAGEAELRGQVADPAAEREAGDPGRADHASRGDEAVGLRRAVEVEPGRAALRAGDTGARVDVDPRHQREVDHEPVVARRSGRPGCARRRAPRSPVLGAGRTPARWRRRLGYRAARDRARTAVDQRVVTTAPAWS